MKLKSPKKTPPEWVEVRRVERGLYLSPEGRGGMTRTYACIVYEVTERMGDAWRTRVEDGEPLYESDFPNVCAWFKVLRAATDAVGKECRRLDEKAAKRRTKR